MDIGVNVDGDIIPADKVVIAMGPWSGDAARWLPDVPSISGQKAHSILVRPTEAIGADCLFTQFQNSSGEITFCRGSCIGKEEMDPSKSRMSCSAAGYCSRLFRRPKSIEAILT